MSYAPAPCDVIALDTAYGSTTNSQWEIGCLSNRQGTLDTGAKYFSFSLGSTQTVELAVWTVTNSIPYIYIIEGSDPINGTNIIAEDGSFTQTGANLQTVLPAGNYSVEVTNTTLNTTDLFDITPTLSAAPACAEGVGPGDNYCLQVNNGNATEILTASVAASVYNGDNTGFSTEVGEQLTLTNINSFESSWMRLVNIPDDGRTYTLVSSGVMLMEVYTDTIDESVSNAALDLTHAVTGQGTNTVTVTNSSGFTDNVIVRIFTTTNLTGAAFTVTVTGSAAVITTSASSILTASDISNLNQTLAPVFLTSIVNQTSTNTPIDLTTYPSSNIILSSSSTLELFLNILVEDTFVYTDELHKILQEEITSNAVFASFSTELLTKVEYLLDHISFNDTVISSRSLLLELASSLALIDLAQADFFDISSSNFILSDTVLIKVSKYLTLLDELIFSSSVPSYSFTVVTTSESVFNSSAAATSVLTSIIQDGISFIGNIAVLGEQFFAYAVNAQTNAVTQFDNYNFNSMDYPYAASGSGIYKLDDSDTDDGVAITASIKTGLMDFGSSLKKQVPYAYLGLTENGILLLKTITNIRGVKTEYWYTVNAVNTAVDTTRIEMGKGVKARYWQFELTNVNGEYFELESFEVIPLILERRKQ